MAHPTWRELLKDFTVKAKPDGLWTIALEYIVGPLKLKVIADGSWKYSTVGSSTCSPDGDAFSAVNIANCLYPNGTVGSLIGKIGGSTAGRADGKLFVVGRFCIVEVDEKTRGTLFFTINDEPNGFADNDGEIKVSVFEAF
jgi:hypothetical protein